MGEQRTVRTIVAVDDDTPLLASYQRGFAGDQRRVLVATSIAAALRLAQTERPDLAVVDLRIGDEWGLDLIRLLRVESPDITIILVSGYLSVSVTVAAMRAGASDVLCKPVTCREILRAAEGEAPVARPRGDDVSSLARLQWDYIMRVLADCTGNVSEAARRLGIRRQSLQQRLKKPVPPV